MLFRRGSSTARARKCRRDFRRVPSRTSHRCGRTRCSRGTRGRDDRWRRSRRRDPIVWWRSTSAPVHVTPASAVPRPSPDSDTRRRAPRIAGIDRNSRLGEWARRGDRADAAPGAREAARERGLAATGRRDQHQHDRGGERRAHVWTSVQDLGRFRPSMPGVSPDAIRFRARGSSMDPKVALLGARVFGVLRRDVVGAIALKRAAGVDVAPTPALLATGFSQISSTRSSAPWRHGDGSIVRH